MSYCRIGENGSQVYAYKGMEYFIYLSDGHLMYEKGKATDRWVCHTRKAFYRQLLKIRASGIRVPNHAFTRLERELKYHD